MKIYLGADHGGFELKEKIKERLAQWGYTFEDLGNTVFDPSDDYPDFAFKVAKAVAKNPDSRGILTCRSAAGMVIAANKVKGARAAAAFNSTAAKHSREHNDANILALSGDWTDEKQAKELLKVWLETPFSGEERHIRRIKKIEEYENKYQVS